MEKNRVPMPFVKKLRLIKKFIADFVFSSLPDYVYILIWYKKRCGYFPNLKNPVTFNEKLQWYKLYYRNPLITKLSDKYEVREYVKSIGLEKILNELYGVYNSEEEIDFNLLPESFVLKETHGSGMNIICAQKSLLDITQTKNALKKWLVTNHYTVGREWGYKNIKPKIICEKYLRNKEIGDLIDYKFYCFSGELYVVFVCEGRFSDDGVRYCI